MQENTKKTLKIYWQHSSRYKVVVFGIIVTIIGATVLGVVLPIYLKNFIDILSSSGLPRPIAYTHLLRIIALMAAINFVAWICWRLASYWSAYFEAKVMEDISNTCFQYLHRHSFSFFTNSFVGSLVKRVNWFVRAFEGVADGFLWNILALIFYIGMIAIILTKKNPTIGLCLIGWIIVFLFTNWIFIKYKLKFDIKRNEAETKASGIVADTITNHLNVKLFNGYWNEIKNYAAAIRNVRQLLRFSWNLDIAFEAAQSFLMIILDIGILYIAAKFWKIGSLTVGDFVLLQAYIMGITGRLWDFGRNIRRIYLNLADAEEMTIILNTPPEIVDVKKAKILRVRQGLIELKNVDFNYHSTRKVLSKFNLTIKPKERLALVGPSGAGKTTIVRLLLRLHDLTGGKITIDGQRITGVTQESLWKNISLVPQDPVLFHRSLMENIRYGRPDTSDKEIFKAAKLARAHEFISRLPEGYNTFVGERGVKLSGGERQRVAIARAILRNAPILVLDEATSSLDSESEHLIQEALGVLMRDKTVIVIAHRLSTIMKMNRIVVITENGIAEEGTHNTLLKKKDGIYSRLWQVQAGGFLK